MKHTIKLLTLAFTLAAIFTLTGCPGPVNTIEPPVWDDGVVKTEPTCTTEGVKTYTCSNGETRTETIPALGHDHIVTYSDNICTTPGTKTTTCSRCDYSVTENIDALGHSYIWITTKITTKTEHGEKIHKCSRCSHIDETEVIHNFEAGGCDICGAYEHNKEDDYQIMAYVYSSVEDAKKGEKGENARVLYFSFPASTEISKISLNSLIHRKSNYTKKTVSYNIIAASVLEEDEKNLYSMKDLDLDNGGPMYIVVE